MVAGGASRIRDKIRRRRMGEGREAVSGSCIMLRGRERKWKFAFTFKIGVL